MTKVHISLKDSLTMEPYEADLEMLEWSGQAVLDAYNQEQGTPTDVFEGAIEDAELVSWTESPDGYSAALVARDGLSVIVGIVSRAPSIRHRRTHGMHRMRA